MTNRILSPEAVCQIAFIVHDIERAGKKFCEIFGVEMPKIIVTAAYEITKTTYKGEPCDATAKLAFFNAGQVQFELIEPDQKPSVWRDFLNEHGEGIHHIAFRVENTAATTAALAGQGIPVVQQGLYSDTSGMYTYLDAAPVLGVLVELLENFKRD